MLISGNNFKIGADPEFFLKRAGELVSAYGLVAGTKKNPLKVPLGAVQVDGMALEFNIDPAEDFKDFEKNITSVMDTLSKMVPGYEIFVNPVANFGESVIEAQPEEAKMLGCDPDFNAYTGELNPIPDAKMPFRTASGHIHIGWTDDPVDVNDASHFEACRYLTKWLDLYLAVPSLLWDDGDGAVRRKLYGKAGAFRPKPYGMEYRVLSNRWIDDPVRRKLVFSNTVEAIHMCFGRYNEIDKITANGMSIPQIIDGDTESESTLAGMFSVFTHNQFPVKTPSYWRNAA